MRAHSVLLPSLLTLALPFGLYGCDGLFTGCDSPYTSDTASAKKEVLYEASGTVESPDGRRWPLYFAHWVEKNPSLNRQILRSDRGDLDVTLQLDGPIDSRGLKRVLSSSHIRLHDKDREVWIDERSPGWTINTRVDVTFYEELTPPERSDECQSYDSAKAQVRVTIEFIGAGGRYVADIEVAITQRYFCRYDSSSGSCQF